MLSSELTTFCVYAIKNLINRKAYIGSTVRQFKERRREHQYALRADRHRNHHLQHAWNKYGENYFDFVILELIDDINLLIKQEQYWLDLHRSNGGVYNFGDCAKAPWSGCHHTKETRQKIRVANLGRQLSKEACQKISIARKGKHLTQEHKQRIGVARKGLRHTKETRQKMSITQRARCQSEEVRQKISAALKGRPCSKKTRQKLSVAKKGNTNGAKQYPAFIDPIGTIYSAGINLAAFCCTYNLNADVMRGVIDGRFKQHKGWRLACYQSPQ